MRYNKRIGYVKFYIELKKENNGADGKKPDAESPE
jgi:hypothetical protein